MKKSEIGFDVINFEIHLPIYVKHIWMAKSWNLDPGKSDFFSNTFFYISFLKNGTRTFFSKNLKLPKFHVPAIQKMFILR